MKQIIQSLISAITGLLSNLTTTDKSNLVSAINEVKNDVGTSNLQSVSNVGDITTTPLISKDSLQVGQPSTAFVGKIKGDNLTATRNYLVADKDGTFAMLSDVTMNVATLNTVADFATYTSTSTIDSIIIKDRLGGIFNRYTGSIAADNGIIFTDANSVKWKRVLEDYINLDWYMDPTTGWADTPWANAYAAAINTENLLFARIYCPLRSLGYVFMTPVIIDTKIELFGDGGLPELKFGDAGTNIAGLTFNYWSSRYSIIRNITIKGNCSGYPSGTPLGSDWNPNNHGIVLKDVLYLNNVTVRGFEGSGFYGNGNVGNVGDPSNINTSMFINCHALENRKHGYEILGQDANAIEFERCDAISNGATGFHDYCFLGNNYRAIHSASNSSPEMTWQRSLVKYLGVSYACIVDGTVGITPVVGPNWQLTPVDWTGWSSVKDYDPTVTYYEGGAWSLVGLNQYGTMVGCYAESDQPSSFIDQRVVGINASAALRSRSALIAANSGYPYTGTAFFAGNPGPAANTMVSFISQVEGIGVKYNSITMGFSYDAATNSIYFLGTFIKMYNLLSTAGQQNRTNAAGGIPLLDRGFLMSTITDRLPRYRVELNMQRPTLSTYDLGDLAFSVPYKSAENYAWNDRHETIVYKKILNSGTNAQQWAKITGFTEYEFTTTNNALTQLFDELVNINVGQYDITVTARNTTTGDAYTEKRIITFGPTANALPTVIKQSLTLQSFSEGTMSGVVIGMDVRASGNNLRLYVNGLAATNINWIVKVNRLVSN